MMRRVIGVFIVVLLMLASCTEMETGTSRGTDIESDIETEVEADMKPEVNCSDGGTEGAKPEIVELINAARSRSRKCGTRSFKAASPVEWNDTLGDAALNHSLDMALNDFFDHEGSDGSSLYDRVVAAGYPRECSVGENIFLGVTSSEEAVEGWLKSSGHCANIMNPDFSEVGAAAVRGGTDGCGPLYWTLVLADH